MLSYKKNQCVQYASTDLISLGSEKRTLDDGGWHSVQSTSDRHVLAFSFLPVKVAFEGQSAVVLAPMTVAMPRPWDHYTRSPLCDRGQRTVFLSMNANTARQCVAGFDPTAMDHEDSFPARNGPSSAKALAMARQLERLVFEQKGISCTLEFDELAMQIISISLNAYYSTCHKLPHVKKPLSESKQRDQVQHAIVLMCLQPSKNWSLSEIAGEVDLSPAYLSRVFKRHTGKTLTQCLRLIRISYALERLPENKRNLTGLALETGFSSHAHMSSTFMETLGTTPSSLAKSSSSSIAESLNTIRASLSNGSLPT